MMTKIFLTEGIISGATTYMPLLEKDKWAREAAGECINRVMVSASDNGKGEPMPDYYILNQERKSRALYGLLANHYLGFALDLTEECLMAADDYDRWAGSHVMNQLERMKRTAQDYSLRDKIFDLLYDYRDAERRLNTEIASILNVQNDPCTRMMAMMSMQTSPEYMAKAKEELQTLMRQVEEYKEKHAAGSERAGSGE